MQFHIENMTCGGCVRSVTRAIQAVDPTADVQADPVSHKVEVISQVPPARLIAALTEIGYAPG